MAFTRLGRVVCVFVFLGLFLKAFIEVVEVQAATSMFMGPFAAPSAGFESLEGGAASDPTAAFGRLQTRGTFTRSASTPAVAPQILEANIRASGSSSAFAASVDIPGSHHAPAGSFPARGAASEILRARKKWALKVRRSSLPATTVTREALESSATVRDTLDTTNAPMGLAKPSRPASIGHSDPIPILSVSLTSDPLGYVPRLLRSIDFPVQRIVLLVGNSNATLVDAIAESVMNTTIAAPSFLRGRVELTRIGVNPGCSAGWNHGVRAMLGSAVAKWVYLVNSDIAFKPGHLALLASRVQEKMQDASFGVGYVNLDVLHLFSAFVLTRRAAEVVGFFDENFYPAYYEDIDYRVRLALAGLRCARLHCCNVSHGEVRDASRGSLGGVQTSRRKLGEDAAFMQLWHRGRKAGQRYYKLKWGCWVRMGLPVPPSKLNVTRPPNSTRLANSDVSHGNKTFVTACHAHSTPFGGNLTIRDWDLARRTRRWILSGNVSKRVPIRYRPKPIESPCVCYRLDGQDKPKLGLPVSEETS